MQKQIQNVKSNLMLTMHYFAKLRPLLMLFILGL